MEEEKAKRYYKIECGDTITVHRKDYNGNSYYSASVKKKYPDGTEEFLSKRLRFKKGIELNDLTRIKITSMFEDGYLPKNSYDVVWFLFILDFEIVDNSIQEYQNNKNKTENVYSNEEVPF